jgi:D-alanyl-D-alanine carboxypeptidase
LSELGIPADYGPRRGLQPQPEAAYLVSIGMTAEGRDIRLTQGTADAWYAMRQAAADSGILILALSGFRSIQRQTEIIRAKLAAGQGIDAILLVNAAPGYSEHHTGRAVDVGVAGEPPLTEAFEKTAAFGWLEKHAGGFGFRLSYPRDNPHGIAYEPWHWFYMK